VLARNPFIGKQITPDSPVWTLPMFPIDGKEIWLLYTFDANAVTLLSMAASNRPTWFARWKTSPLPDAVVAVRVVEIVAVERPRRGSAR